MSDRFYCETRNGLTFVFDHTDPDYKVGPFYSTAAAEYFISVMLEAISRITR